MDIEEGSNKYIHRLVNPIKRQIQGYIFLHTNINLDINGVDLYVYTQHGKFYLYKDENNNEWKFKGTKIIDPLPIQPWPPPRLSSSLSQFNKIDQSQDIVSTPILDQYQDQIINSGTKCKVTIIEGERTKVPMLNERLVSKSNSTNILSIPRETIRKVKANAVDIVANTRSTQESHCKLIKSALSRIDNDSTLQNSSSLKSPQEYANRISQGTCTYIDPINDSPQNVFAIEKNESI